MSIYSRSSCDPGTFPNQAASAPFPTRRRVSPKRLPGLLEFEPNKPMDPSFQAIGISFPNERAFNEFAADVERRGEPTHLRRDDGVLHGRSLKFGKGLEVWTVHYESKPGELIYTDCRPAFRARKMQCIRPWILCESSIEGVAIVHGFIEDAETEVLFEVQNLTEIGMSELRRNSLHVRLCGLAHAAEIGESPVEALWISKDEASLNIGGQHEIWTLAGNIVAFEAIRNPVSGTELFWLIVAIGDFRLELIVNSETLSGTRIGIGKSIRAGIWLQGHIETADAGRRGYEGVDRFTPAKEHWRGLRRPN